LNRATSTERVSVRQVIALEIHFRSKSEYNRTVHTSAHVRVVLNHGLQKRARPQVDYSICKFWPPKKQCENLYKFSAAVYRLSAESTGLLQPANR
jgi:hypothetical protein